MSLFLCMYIFFQHYLFNKNFLFVGNVELWAVGRDNRLDGVCLYKEQHHEEKITQISWTYDSNQQLVLITSSLDGKMCIFKNLSIGGIQLVDK